MTNALLTRTGRIRASLKIVDWPEADRCAWVAANADGNILDPGGRGAHWSPFTRNNVAIGYGRWLAWLANQKLLDPSLPFADRVTEEFVDRYVASLRSRYASTTAVAFLVSLASALKAMAPMHDWTRLDEIIGGLKRIAVPARDKRARIVASDELRDFGLALMAEAEQNPADTSWRRPVRYRNGLIVAMLAMRPLRRRNFCAIEIGQHLVKHGGGYWLRLKAAEVKNNLAYEMPFPADLVEHLERYLSFYRPWLCRLTGHRNSAQPFHAPGARLWVSKTGSAMSPEVFYKNVRNLTAAQFGHSVNPHLFRDCMATSIAINDPDHVRITRSLLGHKTSATAEKFYNQASSIHAAGRLRDCIMDLRRKGNG